MYICNDQASEEVGHNHVCTESGCVAPYKHYTKPKSQSKALMAVLDEKVCWNLQEKNIQHHTPAVHPSNFL